MTTKCLVKFLVLAFLLCVATATVRRLKEVIQVTEL